MNEVKLQKRGKIQRYSVQLVDNPSINSGPLLTVAEAADILRVSSSTIWRLKQSRKIRFYKIGGCIRFLKSDLLSYLEAHAVDVIE
ncbi:MAG TPA: helix-turn-helix domain-containing protein [Candidatus Paceibacterota bacterium]|nr:helix-turn-helix domain-containing protein [Candidatus Paceibacterota bacterium]